MKNKLNIAFSWTAVLICMLLIFYLSSQAIGQSNMLSKGFAKAVISAAEKVAPGLHFDLRELNNLVRKIGHFIGFFMFSVLMFNARKRSGLKGAEWFFLALGFLILYAVFDEIHQLYIPGRDGRFLDIVIDSAGVLVGSIIYKSVSLLRARWQQAAARKI